MRIVSWNCATGWSKKRAEVLGLDPDVAVIPECSEADAEAEEARGDVSFREWRGAGPRKGLAIFTYGGAKADSGPALDDSLHFFIPLRVLAPTRLNVLGVWTHAGPYRRHSAESCGYVGQVHRALSAWKDFLVEAPSVVIGDFNSSAIWDASHPTHSQTDLVARFAQLDMVSLYHAGSGETQGAETTSTHFFWHQEARPFHIDYAFASRSLVEAGATMTIGQPDRWLHLSDHMPLIVDLPSVDGRFS